MLRVEALTILTFAQANKGVENTCDRLTSRANNQEGNVTISHLHKQTKGGKYIP